MNIFMIGGTGLLGCEAAHQLIEKGHNVTTVALAGLPEGAPIPKEMKIEFGDINKRSDDEILELMKGNDVFIFAAGVDERVEFPAPVMDYYKKFNIAPLERMFPLCKKAGIKRAVILGSYFAFLAKQKPEMQCAQRNPYIKSRLMQEEVCKNAADENFSTCVLELPYIFGTQPGRKPVWTILIEQIEFMDKWPFTMYPKGGTAMLTCRQVGEVICGAALSDHKGYEALPIAMYNMKWDKFLGIVYDARGMSGRKILGVAPWMMKMGMKKVVKEYAEKGIESGIDPYHLPYIMDYDLFIDSSYAKDCGATADDIEAAIHDSIKVSVAAYNGTAKLLEMKAE